MSWKLCLRLSLQKPITQTPSVARRYKRISNPTNALLNILQIPVSVNSDLHILHLTISMYINTGNEKLSHKCPHIPHTQYTHTHWHMHKMPIYIRVLLRRHPNQHTAIHVISTHTLAHTHTHTHIQNNSQTLQSQTCVPLGENFTLLCLPLCRPRKSDNKGMGLYLKWELKRSEWGLKNSAVSEVLTQDSSAPPLNTPRLLGLVPSVRLPFRAQAASFVTPEWQAGSLPHPQVAFSITRPQQANFPAGLRKMETSHGEGELELVMGGFPISYDKQSSQWSSADGCLSRELAVAWVGPVSTKGRWCLPSVCPFVARVASPGANPFFLASPTVLCLVSMDTEICHRNSRRNSEQRKRSDRVCFSSS